MAIVDINSIEIGTQISFKTINPTDNNVYEGTVVGFGTYSVAKNSMDILPYYQAVKKGQPNMAPIDQLQYFILEYLQEGSVGIFVCAKEWVERSTLQIISLQEYFDIRIYNRPQSEVTTVLTLLQSHGYSCNQIVE